MMRSKADVAPPAPPQRERPPFSGGLQPATGFGCERRCSFALCVLVLASSSNRNKRLESTVHAHLQAGCSSSTTALFVAEEDQKSGASAAREGLNTPDCAKCTQPGTMWTPPALPAAVLLAILSRTYAEGAASQSWRAVQPYGDDSPIRHRAVADAASHGRRVRDALDRRPDEGPAGLSSVARRDRRASRSLALRKSEEQGLVKRAAPNGTVSYLTTRSK